MTMALRGLMVLDIAMPAPYIGQLTGPVGRARLLAVARRPWWGEPSETIDLTQPHLTPQPPLPPR
jgi:hypothetical protein